MNNKLLVLSPGATDPKTALQGFRPFKCGNLGQLFEEVAKQISDHKARTGHEIDYVQYTIFPSLFYGRNPENVEQSARIELSQKVYLALVDCSVFEANPNWRQAIGALWGLLFFTQNETNTAVENKAIYIINNAYGTKYRDFFTLESKMINSDEALVALLVYRVTDSKLRRFLDNHPLG